MHSWDVQQTAVELRQRGATHLLVSLQDANFIAQFDRSGRQLRAVKFLIQEFLPVCTRESYQNEEYKLVEFDLPIGVGIVKLLTFCPVRHYIIAVHKNKR